MATISIYPNKKSWAGSPGTEWNRSSVGSSIKQAFSNTIKSTGTLKDSLASLKKQIDSVSSLVDVEDSSANLQAAKEREETKVGALSLAYDKIEEYMAKVERVDQDVQSEIRRLKENFYKRYYYLKPDCEKTKKELAKDWVKGKIEAFGEWIADIGEAIKNIVVGIVDWVKKNWKELVIGLAVIVVGAIITVLLSPAAGAVFWQAVGATIFKGLIVAGISAAVSGTISFGVTLYQAKKAGLGTKEAFGYAAQAFGDGLAHGFMTGAFSFAVGSLVNIGAQAFMGKSMLQSSSLFGSIGKGAMYGAVTEGTTSTVVTALEYFVENGTLEGGFDVIFQSTLSGIISGSITGGIMGGKQFQLDSELEDILSIESGDSFTWKLRGEDVTLDDIKVQEVTYVKRNSTELKTMRDKFNSVDRKSFLKELGGDTEYLKNAGFSEIDIKKLQNGRVPDGWQVHHKLPLDDSGTNTFDNFVLIQNEPYHKVITNYQNSVVSHLCAGDEISINWPMIEGNIYPAIH